jgi:hypothetical protein
MAKTYRISFIATADLVPAIVAALTPEIGAMTIEDMSKSPTVSKSQVIKTGSRDTPVGRSTIVRALLNALESGPKNNDEIGEAFKRVGFSLQSIHSAVRLALRADLITREGRGEKAIIALKAQPSGGGG